MRQDLSQELARILGQTVLLNMMKSESESESANRNSEPESGQSDRDNEITEEEEFRPVAESRDLNAEYPTFAEFEEDLKRYGAATYQTFIKRRSEKLKATRALFSIRYKKLAYTCVHHSKCKPEGSGKREFLHSRKKGRRRFV